MRVLRSVLLGVAGGLLLTVGTVKCNDAVNYMYQVSSGVITDAEAQDIYGKIVRATGQGGGIPQTLNISNLNIINAYTTTEGITIYRGLLNMMTKDELALVLGHEVSHFVLGHVFLPPATQTKDNIRIEEMQADKYGAVLAIRAGYNVCDGRAFFKMLNATYGDNQDQDHPDFAFRYDQLNLNCEG